MFRKLIARRLEIAIKTLGVSAICLLLLVSSCASNQSKKIAEVAVSTFHSQFNAQQCNAIYAQSDLELRKSFTETNFLQFCKQIYKKLGSVKQTLQADGNVATTAKETLVTLIYETQFNHGTAQEQFVWLVSNDKAVLRQYTIDMKTSPLHASARAGDRNTVEQLIRSGADVNSKDPGGAGVLQNAARSGDRKLVEFLLQQGAKINDRDDNGATPLNWAVVSGNIDLVKLLMTKGADTTTRANNGMTLLHDAAYSCNPEMVRLIIMKGGNVKRRSQDGATALHSAALCRNRGVIELLINQGVDVNAKTKTGATAITIAKVGGNQEIVKLLQARGAQ